MEDLIPFLIFVGWMIVNALANLAKKKGPRPEPDEADAGPDPLEALLREATAQQQPAGVPTTQSPAGMPTTQSPAGRRPRRLSEYEPTESEHERTASEHIRTASEHQQTAIERAATASEQMRTASEHMRTAEEHARTASEHEAGDMVWQGGSLPPPPPPPGSQRRKRTAFGKAVLGDLRGGGSLRRSLVVREILSPPVSMREQDSR